MADRAARARALAALRFGDADLDRVLAGTVQLSSSQWRRLRAGLGQ
jgi:hypothetical protein